MSQHRIALVSSSYHPYAGGVETHVRSVARELTRRGHVVTVWTVDRGQRLGVRLVDGTEVRYLPTPLPSRSPRDAARFVARAPVTAWAWWRALRALDPTVLHVHCFGPNGVYALLLGALSRRRVVFSAHGETFMDDHGAFERPGLLTAALRRMMRRADVVTGCSEVVLDDLRARFGLHDGLVVPNGVDLQCTAPTTERDPSLVFAVGRLEHTKGFDLLVEAFARLDPTAPTRLVIGGDGAARPDLERLVAQRGLADRVRLVGRLDPTEVAAFMAQAGVVVVPSRHEAFGIVVLEAWRAGAPLVVTRRGGPAEFVTDGVDGLLVDPEDTDELARALDRVMAGSDLAARLAATGLETVRAFTWSRVADLYQALYRA